MSQSHQYGDRENADDDSSVPRNRRLHQKRPSQIRCETKPDLRFTTPTECMDWSDNDVWHELQTSRSYTNQTVCTNWLRHLHPGWELLFILLILCTPPIMLLIPFTKRLLAVKHGWSSGSESGFEKSELQSGCTLDCETKLVNLAVRYFLLCISSGIRYSHRFKAVVSRPRAFFSNLITCRYQTGEQSCASAVDISVSFLTFMAFLSYWTMMCLNLFGFPKSDTENNESTSPFNGGNPFSSKAKSSSKGGRITHLNFPILSKYASDFVDIQLLILLTKTILSRFLLRLGNLQYCIHVYRSPDCKSFVHQINAMEIGAAAEQIILSLACHPRDDDPLIMNPRRNRRRSRKDFKFDWEDPSSNCRSQSRSRSDRPVRSTSKCNEMPSQGNSYVYYTVDNLAQRNGEAGTNDRVMDKDIGLSQSECNNYEADRIETNKSAILLSTMDAQSLNESANKRNRIQVNFELALRKRRAALREIAHYWFRAVRTEDWCKVEKGPKETYRQYIKSASLVIYDQISRRLLKYLTMIGQKPQHDQATICRHIELYLMCNMSADAFLHQYFQYNPKIIEYPNLIRKTCDTGLADRHASECATAQTPNADNGEEERLPCTGQPTRKNKGSSPLQTWKIHLGNQSIHHHVKHGVHFRLSRAETTLLCYVYRMPACRLKPIERNARLALHQVQPQGSGIPASTMDTSITNSEQCSRMHI